ncbi:T9SS type A sorting domain-containing protein [Raineya orbicola]|uniref:Por secretion system C-terminal sorting domain n=1 Tax=Raineya orbicola TaxID=2016530 RepID=A0A2N3IE85_9BACT|nr:T9SS type A sorting domain-containing protein [Raineya orbicola]PKQ68609.1 Por secretion system C-terminal sorting domain [Raineya orbicola]
MKQNFYTKIFYLLLLFWVVGERAMGQIFTEEFNYGASNGALTTVGSANWTEQTAGSPNVQYDASGSLSFGSYPTNAGKATFSNTGQDIYRQFTDVTSGTLYAGFIMKITAVNTTGDYFAHFSNNGTFFHARLFARTKTGGYELGLAKGGSGGTTAVYNASSTTLTLGTNYFVVLKYDFGTNATDVADDVASVFVFSSSVPLTEPGTPEVTATAGTGTLTELRRFAIRQGTAANAPSGEVDYIRVGTTWADVTSAAATPTLTVSPASLSGFTTTVGSASSSQTYTLSGSSLTPASGNITVTAPANFEVSTDNSTFSASLNVAYNSGTLSATTIYVRIAASAPAGPVSGNVANAGGGATTQNVAVSGTVNPLTPALTVTPASLSGFSTSSGTPSGSQTYTLSGSSLTPASGNITVTAPANFEVSTDNSTFSASLNVAYNSGTLSATTIYVRIAASAPVGPVSGNVANAGGGATTQNVAVSGTVSAPFTPVYEPFAGTGNLNGQNGWNVHNGTPNQVQRIAGNLNYSGLETATGNKIQMLSTQSEDLNKGFTSLTSGVVYSSFVMRVSDVSKFQTNTNIGTYFLHFAEEAGTTFTTFNFVARVHIRQGSAANTYQLGVLSKGGGTPTAANIYGSSPQDLAINTNYFVVIKYDFATQNSSIFINPVPGSPEPTPTFISTFGTSTPTDIESICIRNSNTSGVGTGDIEIDELRVGITWAQVTPPNTSPVINVNPASLNPFSTNTNTASAVQDYIVSASNLTSNLVITAPAGFEIKRSTDATYASSVTLVPTSGNVPNTTINVRLAASNTNAKILIANITNTSGTLTENVAVRGVVNATLANFPDTPKDQLATPQTYTFSAVGLSENLVVTNNDNQNYSLSKDGTNFVSTLTFTPAEVNNNNVTISVRFEPKSDVNGLKPVNLQHSANALTAIVSTEGKQLAPLSIADELAAQTIVFPNPASKFIQVQTSGAYQITLQDVTGRKVGEFISNETINVEKLPNGLYFLQFSNENVRFVKRLIIQK